MLQVDTPLFLCRRLGSFAGRAACSGKPGMAQQLLDSGANAVAIGGVRVEVAAKNEAVDFPQPSSPTLVIDDVVSRCPALKVVAPETYFIMIAATVSIFGTVEDRRSGV